MEHTNDLLRLRLRLYERESDTPRWEANFGGTTNDVIALERGALEQLARALDRDIDDEALEIDDTCFVARYRLANKRLQYDFAWEGSMAEHERLIELWPEHNLAWTKPSRA